MAPLNRLEEIFAEFLDWKTETWDAGFLIKYLATTTHSNLRQSILGFTAMCRFYIGKFPKEAILSGGFMMTLSSTTSGMCAAPLATTPVPQPKSAAPPLAMQPSSGFFVTQRGTVGAPQIMRMTMTTNIGLSAPLSKSQA